tara:strand:- start:184 stop:459 length:276 start_codon:yes stop_codon:yes gene_type:complete
LAFKLNKKSNKLPEYSYSKDEFKWYKYCVDNNIRISFKPVKDLIGVWYITINLGPYIKGEKTHLSPETYTIENVHKEYYKMCKYYYDKRKK